MKLRTLIFAFALLFSRCLFAQSAPPLDRSEILGRLALANSPSYIGHLVKARGISFLRSTEFISSVKLAGGDGILVERLTSSDSSSSSNFGGDRPFDHLAKCAELIHTGAVESAEQECRDSIAENPQSPWPLLVTAKLLQRSLSASTSSDDDKDADKPQRELLQRAASLAPNLAEIHQGLATLGGPDAASEMQKASSLDPSQLQFRETDSWSNMIDLSAFSYGRNWGSSDPPSAPSEPISIDPELLRRIQIEPDLASNHMGLANQYFQAHDFEKAEGELREAIRLEPDSPEGHMHLAALYFAEHKKDNGLFEIREGVRIVPFGRLEHMLLAGALEESGRTPEAVTELQAIIAVHPADVESSNGLVELYLTHKDRMSAIKELRRSLDATSLTFTDPAKAVQSRFGDQNRLAYLLEENQELDASAEQFLFLLHFNPDSADLHNDYGNVLLAQRRLDEAIGEYNQALRLEPEMANAHHNIGICLALKKNLDGAIAQFRQALELDPNTTNTQAFLGAALAQKGDQKAAMDQFQKAIEQNPADVNAHISLAYALDQAKDTSDAINELKLALQLQPDSPGAENNLAWIYATADDHKLRNPTQALVLARRAVESSPQANPAFLDTLAEALLMNGHAAEAFATETEAVRLDPENSELQSRLPRFRDAVTLSASSNH